MPAGDRRLEEHAGGGAAGVGESVGEARRDVKKGARSAGQVALAQPHSLDLVEDLIISGLGVGLLPTG